MILFKVYIEEKEPGAAQLMEVSPDAPIAQVVPALVEELHLPLNDLFGNSLAYLLRHTEDGRLLPDHVSLHAAGVQAEDHLRLESYMADGLPVLASPVAQDAKQNAPYADQTVADASPGAPVVAPLSVNPSPRIVAPHAWPTALPTSTKRWTRRTLLITGGASLGAAVLGVITANAAFNALFPANRAAHGAPNPPVRATAPTGATATAQPLVPTRATSLLVFTQHQQTVHALAWSPDGRMLASGASDKQLFLWEPGGQVRIQRDQPGSIHAIAWSPDTRQLAVASANQVFFLDAQSGTSEAQSAQPHHATVTALAWSRQQSQFLVSAGLDKLAVVWDTRTFRPQTFFRKHGGRILAADWAWDGETVGTCSDGGAIRVWNGPTGEQLHNSYAHGTVSMSALAFAPIDVRLAVGGQDGEVLLWSNSVTCQQVGTGSMADQCIDKPQYLSGHSGAIHKLGWSPDGRLLASASEDGALFIWYPAQNTSAPLLKIPHDAPVLAVSWSPDGRKIATASGTRVSLWALS